MGIKTFWKILDGQGIGEEGQLCALEGSALAIDLSGWIVASQQITSNNRKIRKPHLRDLFWKANQLIRNQVKVVFVLDGTAPSLKASEIRRRQLVRQKCNEDKRVELGGSEQNQRAQRFETLVEECCLLLDALGLPWMRSEGEAEATCAWLNQHGVVDGVVSQDGDTFLFGANTVYRDFSADDSKVSFRKYSMEDIEQKLGFSQNHLVALALLLGCDYDSEGVKGIGKEQAVKLLKGWNTVDPIHRFQNWRENKKLDKLESYKQLKKPIHCGQCQHLGSVTSHRKGGCLMCRTNSSCIEHASAACECVFHQKKAKYDKYALELKVRREALKDRDFPNQQIIDAFLNPVMGECEIPSLLWKPPDVTRLKAFLSTHLGWGVDVFTSRVFPLVLSSTLHHNHRETTLYRLPQPVEIVKQRTKHGQKLFEVIWTNIDPVFHSSDGGITELVPVESFSRKFPSKVAEYEEKQAARNSGGKTKAKPKIDSSLQTTVDNYFRVTKNYRSRLFEKPPQNPGGRGVNEEQQSRDIAGNSITTSNVTLMCTQPKRGLSSPSKHKVIELDSESEQEEEGSYGIPSSRGTPKKLKRKS